MDASLKEWSRLELAKQQLQRGKFLFFSEIDTIS